MCMHYLWLVLCYFLIYIIKDCYISFSMSRVMSGTDLLDLDLVCTTVVLGRGGNNLVVSIGRSVAN